MSQDMHNYFADYNALVVDESADSRAIMSAVLGAFKLKSVTVADDYQKALKNIKTEQIDCIVIDWMSDTKHGLQLVQDVRNANHHIANIPIILCTARTDLGRLEEATKVGVDEIIAKPLKPDVVLKKLASAFYGRKAYVVNGDLANKRRKLNHPFKMKANQLTNKAQSSTRPV